MPRFFIDRNDIQNGFVTVKGADAHHASNVLRVRPGDALTLADFFNREYLGTVVQSGGSEVLVKIEEERETLSEPPFPIVLLMAMPKGDKFEWIIQKSTELGVTEIRPFFSRFTVVRYDGNTAGKKTERFEKIAKSAAEQCGRGRIPHIEAPVQIKKALDLYRESSFLKIFCYEKESGRSLKDLLESSERPSGIVFMIGAEGGFDDAEARAASDAGFTPVSLGRRILRCETAPLLVASQIAYRYGF